MKKTLLNCLYASFLLIALLVTANRAMASHAMASDLTYKCLGGNTYEVTLSFYRDCAGITAPGAVTVTVKSASCGQNLSMTLNPIPGTGQEVTPKCSSTVTTCEGGSSIGVQQWVYSGIITLPMACSDWTFGFSICCRNAAITTINSPGTSLIYIASTLNNTGGACVSSPVFSNKPVPFVCVGQPYCFSEAAVDSDGDSLAYQLITPMETATSTINYLPGYTAQQPLTSSPPMAFDSTNGEICMTPQQLQVTVLAVLVKAFKNGVMVSSVERDMQVIVMNCNNNLPWLSGINGTNVFNMTVCAGVPFCFNILSNDIDTGQTLTVTENNIIPGSTFSTIGNPHPTATFCWTPADSQISTTPYNFTVTVKDNACPFNGSQVFNYSITVQGISVSLGPDQAISCTDLATLYATVNSPDAFTYHWSTGDTTNFITEGPGTYWVTVTDATCSASDTIVVTSPFQPIAAFTNSTPSCMNQPVTFTDHSTAPGSFLATWSWNFGDGGHSNVQNPVHTFTGSGTYYITLTVTNGLGCVDSTMDSIVIAPPPAAAFTFTNACQNTPVTFTDLSTGGAVNWNWNFGDGQTSTSQNPTHAYASGGSYTVTLIVSNSNGCPDTLKQTITIYTSPTANFNASPVCIGGTTSFTNTSTGTITGWTWTFGDGGSSTIQNPTYTYSTAGTYNVKLIVTSSNGCIDSITKSVTVNPLPIANAGPDVTICTGSSGTLTASGGTTYSWSPGGGGSNTFNVNPAVNTTYTVTVTDGNGCSATDTTSVKVNPLPVASAGPGASICHGASASLTASGGGTYLWAPTGSTSSSISVSPNSTKTYHVTVTDANGCAATASATVVVNPLPVINLNNTTLCSGDSTTLNAGIAGVRYNWSTGGTTQIITVSNAGTYSLTVTDVNGCTSSATGTVTPIAPIVVALGNPTICQGQSVTLNAGNTGDTYIWSPGGQNTQTITTGTAGTYTVTVTDVNNCKGVGTGNITVNPLPQANYSATTVCAGNSTVFTNTSTITSGTISSYNWNFGNGSTSNQQNPTLIYATGGTYSVTLTESSAAGCNASVVQTVTVNPLPVASFAATSSCLTGSVTFTDQSNVSSGSITAWNWNFGDGNTSTAQNPTHIYSSDSTFSVTLTVTTSSGCTQSFTKPVSAGSVTANPTVTTICKGQTATIDAGNPGYNFAWSTGATTETINVSTAGTYTVTITSPGGSCSATAVETVNENPVPSVNFAAPSICFGNSTIFTDQTTISSGSITSWNWNFGDGNTSNQQNPNNTYTTAGTYSVTLQVNSNNGCSATVNKQVTINPIPVAGYSSAAVCQGDTSFFTDQSTVSNGNIISWNWTFGDGQTSGLQSPIHIYNAAGNYTTTLTITSNFGCSNNVSLPEGVNPLPSPAFTAQDVCYGMPTPFNNTSTISNGTIASYSWSFGDGNTSAAQQPTYQYATSGNYTVILTETSALGCVQHIQSIANVLAKPVASFTVQNACQGNAVNFTDNSTVQGSTISSWNWSFNDGNSSAIQSPNHLYTSPGTYNVQLIVSTNNGCVDTATSPVVIYPLPVADFSSANVCQNSPDAFNNLSTISSGSILSYSWSFGDGSTSLSSSPNHLYSSANTYDVVLITASDHGCVDTVSHSLTVFPLPSVDFTGLNVCYTDTTMFLNNTTITGGSSYTSSWNFGDATNSIATNPTHIYTSSGIFNVTLVAISANGCADSVTKPVNVYIPPVAAFVTKNNCFGIPTELTDSSTSTDGNIINWEWNFGDSTSGTGRNVSHIYKTAGQYFTTLKVTTSHGCSNTAGNGLQIYPSPSPAITAPNVCEGSPDSLVNSGDITNTITSSLWNFGDGSTADSSNEVHTYSDPGTYTVTLQTTNQFGCINAASMQVTIYPEPNTNFTAADGCMGTPVNFGNKSTIVSGNIASYNWNFGDNFGYSTLANPTYNYHAEGTYSVVLNAVSDHGCARQIEDTITLYPLPIVIINGITEGCSPLHATLADSSKINSGSIVGWLWDFGNGDVSTQQFPDYTYTNPGNYIVTLTVSSDKGCVATGTGNEHIVVLPSAKAEFTMDPNTTLNIMNPVVQFTNLSSGYTTYNWNFGDGSTSTVFSPTHTYKDTGDFTIVLVVNNSYNCPDTAMRRLEVEPISTLYAPNAFTPNDDGKNDVWKPVFTDMADIQVWIFDRWGGMIRHWEGLDGLWDGTYMGRNCLEDVYVYQIQGTGVDGKTYQWTGDITLVR